MSNAPPSSTPLATLVVALLAAMFVAAGCGGDSDGADDSNSAQAASKSVAKFKDELDHYYEGTFSRPPTSSPPPAPGKNVWMIDFGLAAASGASGAEGAKAAGEMLGWDVTVFDGKFSADTYLTGIRQAIADDADAIIVYAIDCSLVKAGLEDARDAEILIAGGESADCSDQRQGAPSLFDTSVGYAEGTVLDYARAVGKAQAAWIISQTNGEAKVLDFAQTDIFLNVTQHESFVNAMSACKTCEIVDTVEFVGTDIGPPLQEKAQEALVKHPDANAVFIPYDDVLTAGIAAAIQASGRAAELSVISGGGSYKPNLELIRADRGQNAAIGFTPEWELFHAMDSLNRLFQDEKPVESGIGIQVFDLEHNMPQGDRWLPAVDFKSAYEKAWTGG